MSIHPAFASRFHLLDGIESFETALADPRLRARLDAFMLGTNTTEPPTVPVDEDTVAGPHGPVPVRVYRPDAGGDPAGPGLVWLHGGAFQAGDLDMPEADWTARELALRAPAVVVSVDYRLAVGGVTHPVPLDDVVAAVRWVRDGADRLGIDPSRITVGGASAGGNLAAAAVVRLRDEDGWLPACLLPIYPVLHPVLPPASPSLARALPSIPPPLRFRPEQIAAINRNYLGGPVSRADGYAFPGLADLTGLCRTVVVNAEYDDLRSSGEAFVGQLAVAGVDVAQVLARGMLHGFLNHSAQVGPVGEVLDLMAGAVAYEKSPNPPSVA